MKLLIPEHTHTDEKGYTQMRNIHADERMRADARGRSSKLLRGGGERLTIRISD